MKNTETGPAAPRGKLRRLVADLGWYAPAQVLSTVINLASVAIFTRVLDKEEYGTFTLVLSGVLVLSEFAFGGFQASALRYWYAHEKADEGSRENFLASLLSLYGGVTVLCGLGWPLLAPLLFPGIPWHVALWGLPLLVAQCASRLIQTRTRAVREVRVYFLYSILPMTLSFGVGIVLVVTLRIGAVGLLAAQAAGNLLALGVELVRRFRTYVPRRFRPDRQSMGQLAAFGLPIVAASVGGVVLEYSDRFLIARFFDVATAGVYIVGYQLALKVEQLSMLTLASAFPVLVQDYESRPAAEVGQSLRRLTSVFMVVFAPATAGVALASGPLVRLLLGREFQAAAQYIVPLMPGVFALGLFRYLTKPFQLCARNGPLVVISTAGAAVNVGLNVLLLPRYGPVVAAWTTTVGNFLSVAGAYAWSKRLLPYSLDWGVAARVAAATAGMCLLTIGAGRLVSAPAPSLVLRVVVGAASYAVLAYALGLSDARHVLQKAMARLGARGRQPGE